VDRQFRLAENTANAYGSLVVAEALSNNKRDRQVYAVFVSASGSAWTAVTDLNARRMDAAFCGGGFELVSTGNGLVVLTLRSPDGDQWSGNLNIQPGFLGFDIDGFSEIAASLQPHVRTLTGEIQAFIGMPRGAIGQSQLHGVERPVETADLCDSASPDADGLGEVNAAFAGARCNEATILVAIAVGVAFEACQPAAVAAAPFTCYASLVAVGVAYDNQLSVCGSISN